MSKGVNMYLYDNPLLFAKMEKGGEVVELRVYQIAEANDGAPIIFRASKRFTSDPPPHQRFTSYTAEQQDAIAYFYKMVGQLTMEGFELITKEVHDAPVSQGSGIPF